ncbi:hypothetical protein Moror_5359, partial [Moniliophthora roreri MCA 2997]
TRLAGPVGLAPTHGEQPKCSPIDVVAVNDSTPAQHLRFISAIISLAPEPSPQICPCALISGRAYPARAKIHLEVEEVLSYDHDGEAERRDNEKKMDPYVTFNDRNKNVLCAPLIPDLNHLSESPLR